MAIKGRDQDQPTNDADVNVDRRNFMTATAAVIGGAAALTPAVGLAQRSAQSDAAVLAEPESPPGHGPRAMLDNRFPLTYEVPVPTAVKIVTEYFAAMSRRDLEGIAGYLHFPFVTWEGVSAVRVNSRRDLLRRPPASMNLDLKPERFTDNDGYLMPGAYEVFDGIEVLCTDPVNVGLAFCYMRYDSNGKKLHRCQGIYSVTNNDGRWAIQAMSTIFTPADMIGVEYPDAVDAANRLRLDHDLAYHYSDRRYEPTRLQGARGGVRNQPGQPWSLGPNGRAMEQFDVRGVDSRLSWQDGSEPPDYRMPSANPLDDYAGYRDLFPMSGVGNWGWVIGKLPNTRCLHVSPAKVHIFTGAIRFTTSGEEASHNSNLGVVVYWPNPDGGGKWVSGGNMAYTTPHDRSNDVKPS